MDATEIRLADTAAGFAEEAQPKPMVAFCETEGRYWQSNVSFNNAVKDLTLSVGAGNPAAVGIDYHNNNTGFIRNVRIRSLDPARAGYAGLRMPGGLSGIGLMQDITVEGFRFGVHTRYHKIGYIFERLTLRGQTEAGIVSHDKPLWIRRLVSDNTVPAVVGGTPDSHIVLLDSDLRGGAADAAAVVSAGHCFLRDVRVAGYTHAVNDRGTLVPATTIDEYLGGSEPLVLGAGPARSLRLPIEDPPEIPLGDVAKWVHVDGAAQGDDSAAIQAAIDSGAATVVIDGNYEISQPIVIRGGLRVLRGGMPGGIGSQGGWGIKPAKNFPAGQPLIRIESGDHDAVLFDSINTAHHPVVIENRSEKTVVIRDMSAGPYRGYGPGRVFFESCVGGYGTGAYEMVPYPFVVLYGQRAWLRHYNPEGSFPHLVNDGGEVVVIGAKFGEWHGPYVVNANGGRTEILGALFNSIETQFKPLRAMVRNDGGEIALVVADDQKSKHMPHAYALRQAMVAGEQRVAYADLPDRGERKMLGLVVGRSDVPVPAADAPVATVVVASKADVALGLGEAARVRVVLDRPTPVALSLRLFLSSPSTVDESVFGGTLPTLSIPAGASEVEVELPITGASASTEIAVVRVMGGVGYRSDPIDPGAHFTLMGNGVDLDAGLDCRVVPSDRGPVEDSGKKQQVHPKNITTGDVAGRRALIFDLKGSELKLGTVGQGFSGFMHRGFRTRSFALWVHADGEAGNLLREGGGYGGMFLTIKAGRLCLAHATGNILSHEIDAPWPLEQSWRHVVGVFAHGWMELYLDGKLVAAGRTAVYDTGPHSAPGGIGVGGLRGAIAEGRIYDRALTASEVAALAALP